MGWAQQTSQIPRIQDWTLNWFQAWISNPQTKLPPLFFPGSLIATLLYFGWIPMAKSSNPADETQISITWQHMIYSVWLHSGQERGLHHCRELFRISFLSCACSGWVWCCSLDLPFGTSSLAHVDHFLPYGLNLATWINGFKITSRGCVPFSHHGTSFLKPWRNLGLLLMISSALTPRLPVCADGWKWLATGKGNSNSSCYQNYHCCVLSVTKSTVVFPLLFNPLDSRARSHKNSFQYLHHRNSPKP